MLIPWNRMHHLFDDMHQSLFPPSPSLFFSATREESSPRVPRWREEGDVASLAFNVPGLSEDDITVRCENDLITVEAGGETAPPDGYSLLRKERVVGNFRHQFTLPRDWDPATLSASLQDGVLSLTMEKSVLAQPRTIPVTTVREEASDV